MAERGESADLVVRDSNTASLQPSMVQAAQGGRGVGPQLTSAHPLHLTPWLKEACRVCVCTRVSPLATSNFAGLKAEAA